MNYKGMTREELVNEAIEVILSLTEEQCQRLLENFKKECQGRQEEANHEAVRDKD